MSSRSVGLGLIGLGVVLLLVVFLFAYMEYANIKPVGSLENAVSVLVWAVVKTVFLGIMGWVGAILVARGIDAVQEKSEEKKVEEI